VLTRQVVAHERRRIHTVGHRPGLRDAAGRRFGHQVGLGAELFVEAAVGEACRRHQVGHAHPVEAALAEQLRGRLDDEGSIGLRLRLGDFHLRPP
jgi:hypothetical protein